MLEPDTQERFDQLLNNSPTSYKSHLLEHGLFIYLLDNEYRISCTQGLRALTQRSAYDQSFILNFVVGTRELKLERQKETMLKNKIKLDLKAS